MKNDEIPVYDPAGQVMGPDRLYLPLHVQEMLRSFMKHYIGGVPFSRLDPAEKEFCQNEREYELMRRWVEAPAKTFEWPFPSAQYDYTADGPWPQPGPADLAERPSRAAETGFVDVPERERLVTYAEESAKIKKAAKDAEKKAALDKK